MGLHRHSGFLACARSRRWEFLRSQSALDALADSVLGWKARSGSVFASQRFNASCVKKDDTSTSLFAGPIVASRSYLCRTPLIWLSRLTIALKIFEAFASGESAEVAAFSRRTIPVADCITVSGALEAIVAVVC